MVYNRKIIIIVLCILSQATSGFSETMPPGKYAGIPIFDRWDGCCLGISELYVSNKIKDRLRPYAGKSILIDVKKIWQPMNPGNVRIDSFKYLGFASDNRKWLTTTGFVLITSAKTDNNGKIIVTISIKNTSDKPVKFFSQELRFTTLTKRSKLKHIWITDRPSYAFIRTRTFKNRWQEKGFIYNKPYFWSIGKENVLSHYFILKVGELRNIRIHFDLPPGEYDFICAYGKCLSSNLTAFDVHKDGKAKIITVKGRN